jgi:hypothetical protein
LTESAGRRVDSLDEITEPGDYWYNPAADPKGHRSLWFLLPTAESRDAFAEPLSPHNGLHRIDSTWTITDNPDGSVSAQPSIACGTPVYWHGYLEPGNVWREV